MAEERKGNSLTEMLGKKKINYESSYDMHNDKKNYKSSYDMYMGKTESRSFNRKNLKKSNSLVSALSEKDSGYSENGLDKDNIQRQLDEIFRTNTKVYANLKYLKDTVEKNSEVIEKLTEGKKILDKELNNIEVDEKQVYEFKKAIENKTTEEYLDSLTGKEAAKLILEYIK